jgi:predicted RND superfamily exporter protein
VQEQFKKQNDEVFILKKKLDEETVNREVIVAELKNKFNKQSEELNEQLDSMRKTYANMSKVKQTLEAENVDLANEVKNLNQLKMDGDRKRKQLESTVQDIAHKYQESERQRSEIAEKLNKLQVEIDTIRTSSIDNESRAVQNEKAASAYRTQLLEAQEANQEEIRQKLALQARMRALEDDSNSLKEQLDEKNEREEKFKVQIKQMSDQLIQLKKQSENEKAELEQIEELTPSLISIFLLNIECILFVCIVFLIELKSVLILLVLLISFVLSVLSNILLLGYTLNIVTLMHLILIPSFLCEFFISNTYLYLYSTRRLLKKNRNEISKNFKLLANSTNLNSANDSTRNT